MTAVDSLREFEGGRPVVMVRMITAIGRTIPKTSANFASPRAVSPSDAKMGIFSVPILRAQAAVMCEPRHTRAKYSCLRGCWRRIGGRRRIIDAGSARRKLFIGHIRKVERFAAVRERDPGIAQACKVLALVI